MVMEHIVRCSGFSGIIPRAVWPLLNDEPITALWEPEEHLINKALTAMNHHRSSWFMPQCLPQTHQAPCLISLPASGLYRFILLPSIVIFFLFSFCFPLCWVSRPLKFPLIISAVNALFLFHELNASHWNVVGPLLALLHLSEYPAA